MSVLRISKTFFFFLRTSISNRYRQGSVVKICFQGSVVKTDPCSYLFEYSPDVLKKKARFLDLFNTDKKCSIKNNIESSPREIWIRIRFLEINGSPSLIISYYSLIYWRNSKKNIVLFKSFRNCKRCNKGNFTLKPNSNKILLCGGGGQHYLVLNKIST